MKQPLRLAIVGLGVVGAGTLQVLRQNSEEIFRRTGRAIEITQVGTRRARPDLNLEGITATDDLLSIARADNVDVLIEVIGGQTVAKDVILEAIKHGKHVVTANKALLAENGNEIFSLAQSKGVQVRYEAAVAGGVPIIKVLREGLAANKIDWLAGIINGTGNFIMTEMRDKGRAFADVLAEAQALGYAEADPTFDVEGIDAAHKLMLLASNAFGIPLQFDKVYTEGITKISAIDVTYAEELGYIIKHLGVAKRTEQGIELRVHPTLIPKASLIANVHGVKNAVMVHGNTVGATMYYGAGAGAGPTSSAIVADIVDIIRNDEGAGVPALAFVQSQAENILSIEQATTGYYLRITAADQPAVLNTLTQVLGEAGINIDAVVQKPALAGAAVPIVLVCDPVTESTINQAIDKLQSLAVVEQPVVRIRVERLEV